MCLVTNQSESKIASKDITCYKVLLKLENEINDIVFNNTVFYVSPVMHFTYFSNRTDLNNKVFKAEKAYWLENSPGDDLEPTYIGNEPVSYELNSGFFHMYKDYDSAVKAIKRFVPREKETYAVFECVIPKGSRYYEGFTSFPSFPNNLFLYPSIAADKLKFIKQL